MENKYWILILIAFAAGFYWYSNQAPGTVAIQTWSPSDPAPVDVQVQAYERTIHWQNQTAEIPSHWSEKRTVRVSEGAWYVFFENIPTDQELPANDDFTSPIILIHDGANLWNAARPNEWIVAIMQWDGGSEGDVYVNGKEAWHDVKGYAVAQKFTILGKFFNKTGVTPTTSQFSVIEG